MQLNGGHVVINNVSSAVCCCQVRLFDKRTVNDGLSTASVVSLSSTITPYERQYDAVRGEGFDCDGFSRLAAPWNFNQSTGMLYGHTVEVFTWTQSKLFRTVAGNGGWKVDFLPGGYRMCFSRKFTKFHIDDKRSLRSQNMPQHSVTHPQSEWSSQQRQTLPPTKTRGCNNATSITRPQCQPKWLRLCHTSILTIEKILVHTFTTTRITSTTSSSISKSYHNSANDELPLHFVKGHNRTQSCKIGSDKRMFPHLAWTTISGRPMGVFAIS